MKINQNIQDLVAQGKWISGATTYEIFEIQIWCSNLAIMKKNLYKQNHNARYNINVEYAGQNLETAKSMVMVLFRGITKMFVLPCQILKAPRDKISTMVT